MRCTFPTSSENLLIGLPEANLERVMAGVVKIWGVTAYAILEFRKV